MPSIIIRVMLARCDTTRRQKDFSPLPLHCIPVLMPEAISLIEWVRVNMRIGSRGLVNMCLLKSKSKLECQLS